ncbi:MAG: hypothetical protein ACUVWX_07320 [Kiritimatiellia bacterium]
MTRPKLASWKITVDSDGQPGHVVRHEPPDGGSYVGELDRSDEVASAPG